MTLHVEWCLSNKKFLLRNQVEIKSWMDSVTASSTAIIVFIAKKWITFAVHV